MAAPTFGLAENFIGLGVDESEWDTRLDWAVTLGAEVVRHDLLWKTVEAVESTYDWSQYDSLVTAVEGKGLQMDFLVLGSPQWANGNANHLVVPNAGFGINAAFTTWKDEHASFVADAINRYKPGGTFGSNVNWWELWNEPNLDFFWQPTADPTQFIAFHDAVYTAARAASATVKLVSAPIVFWDVFPVGDKGETFATTFLQADPTLDYFGWHEYIGDDKDVDPLVGGLFKSHLDSVRALLDAEGYTTVPMVVSEWGFQSLVGGGNNISTLTQAQYVASALDIFSDNYTTDDIALSVYFQQTESTDGTYGLFWEPDLAPKQGADAYRAHVTGVPQPSSLADIILADSPIGFWQCHDELDNATLPDSSGNGHVATVKANSQQGGIGFDNVGRRSFRLHGNSSDEGATVPYDAALFPSAGTLEFCIRYHNRINQNSGIWARETSSVNAMTVQMSHVSGVAYPSLGGIGGAVFTASAGIQDLRQWHHVLIAFDFVSDEYTCWLDGVDVTGSVTNRDVGANTNDFRIGDQWVPYALTHVALYNTELVQADVDERWAAVQAERVVDVSATTKYGFHVDAHYNGDAGQRKSEIESVASIYGRVVRHTLLWGNVEPTEGGGYTWGPVDQLIKVANDRDIATLWMIGSSPEWANGGTDRYDIPGTGVDATFTTWVAAHVAFIEDFLDRVKPGGTGPNLLTPPIYFELWNEPNLQGFWDNTAAGGQDPDQYAYWYKTMRAAILAKIPDARVSFAGLSSWIAGAGGGDDEGKDFLANVLASSEWTSTDIDYFAYHNYNDVNDPDSTTAFQNHNDDVIDIRDTLFRSGFTCPILLTEVGASDVTSEADQAAKTTIMLERVRDEWSAFVDYYCLFVLWGDGFQSFEFFETMPTSGAPSVDTKPAADNFKAFAVAYRPPDLHEVGEEFVVDMGGQTGQGGQDD